MRLCRHSWDVDTMRCTGLCGESAMTVLGASLSPLQRAMAHMRLAAQRANRAFKAFGARLDA
jgi:hypothetical protein